MTPKQGKIASLILQGAWLRLISALVVLGLLWLGFGWAL